MRTFASISIVFLLSVLTALSALACDVSPDAPTSAPSVGQTDGGGQSTTQPGLVKQVDQPTSVAAATAEVRETEAAVSPTPKSPVAAGPPQRSPVPPQVFTMPMQVTYVTAKNLDNAPDGSSDELAKLVAHSTLIVIGTTADAEPREERIPGRLPSDPSKPDPNYATVANVYEVQVERYLKGEGDETLQIIQPTGYDAIVPGPGNTPGRVTQGRDTSPNLLLGRNSRYLLFLRENDHASGLWMGTVQPYKFLLSEGEAKVESPVGTLEGAFPDRSETELVSMVEGLLFVSLPYDLPQSGESGSAATSTPTPTPASPGPTPAVSEALLQDASQYAADVGVTLDEAVRRLQAQRTIGELGAELEANEQSTFGGLWIQHTPEYKVVVAFTRDGEETVRRYVTGTSLADMVEVREVEATLVELRRSQREAMAILRELGIRAASGIDITNNVVQLYLSEDEKEELDAGLKRSGLELPDKVKVVI